MGLIDFGNLCETSVEIGKGRKWYESFLCLPENVGCIPLAFVILTTANVMQPTFFPEGIHIYFLSFPIYTKYSRNLPKCVPISHEVFWSPLDPC